MAGAARTGSRRLLQLRTPGTRGRRRGQERPRDPAGVAVPYRWRSRVRGPFRLSQPRARRAPGMERHVRRAESGAGARELGRLRADAGCLRWDPLPDPVDGQPRTYRALDGGRELDCFRAASPDHAAPHDAQYQGTRRARSLTMFPPKIVLAAV